MRVAMHLWVKVSDVFAIEADMKAPVRRWLTNRGMHVAEEFATGWGVCDLVGCQFDPKKVAYRTKQKQRQPLGSPQTVFIYNQLPDADKTPRGMRLETLAKRHAPYISLDSIERSVARLVATNHVQVTQTGTFQKVNGWAPMYTHLMAVELKLNRLTEVLEQARSNRAMVPESLVALPEDVANRAMDSSYADRLSNEGIGLLSVSKKRCRLLLEARPNLDWLDEAMELWVVENFWRIYRGKH